MLQKQKSETKKEIDKDPRKASDLFVDRYRAQPVQEAFLIPDGN